MTTHKKNPSSTKIGPSRYHIDGHKHGTSHQPAKGAGFGFVQRVASQAHLDRKLLVKLLGRRQAKKAMHAKRLAQETA